MGAHGPGRRPEIRGELTSRRRARVPAEVLPVARVAVDVSLPHLDRPFDYLVPVEAADAAQPGVRVRVRFSGQLVDGYVLERVPSSEVTGRLLFLERVVSAERVLTPEVARLARAVADRYAGTLADVLRLAVPPRHARAESAATVAAASGGSPDAAALDSAGPGAALDPAAMALLAGAGQGTPLGAAATTATLGTAGSPDQADLARPAIAAPDPAGWARYPAGAALLAGLADGRSPRAVWNALPGEDWPKRLAEAVAATLHSGRGAIVVVADARDLDRLDAALAEFGATAGATVGAEADARVGATAAATVGAEAAATARAKVGEPTTHVALSAALGPAKRYRRFLRASRGEVGAVIGTRAAMFAPVADLGLVVIWDDGDDLHAEPRAPYPHAREVLLTRAQLAGAGAIVAGHARTAEAQLLLETGWAKEVVAARDTVRACAPAVVTAGDDARDGARLPTAAWRTARDALHSGAPVLVQVPRRGYLPSVSCVDCHTPARCVHCGGPLALASSHAVAGCRWCGRAAAAYACPACGGRRLRAGIVGARRTAEELGRAFPGVPVRTSGRDGVLADVPDEPALVVATPGAEPVVAGAGYGAVLLLDTWALLTRADLRAGEEALRRWFAAAALARPQGTVVVTADGALRLVQALLRWDPAWAAGLELAERIALGFPPAVRMASITGPATAVAELLDLTEVPDGTATLGPVPASDGAERVLLRVSRSSGAALAAALHAAAGVRSARKAREAVRVQVDPRELT